jgi:hypothetical protein
MHVSMLHAGHFSHGYSSDVVVNLTVYLQFVHFLTKFTRNKTTKKSSYIFASAALWAAFLKVSFSIVTCLRRVIRYVE